MLWTDIYVDMDMHKFLNRNATSMHVCAHHCSRSADGEPDQETQPLPQALSHCINSPSSQEDLDFPTEAVQAGMYGPGRTPSL